MTERSCSQVCFTSFTTLILNSNIDVYKIYSNYFKDIMDKAMITVSFLFFFWLLTQKETVNFDQDQRNFCLVNSCYASFPKIPLLIQHDI